MDWYRLFRQHILDRGIEYYEDGVFLCPKLKNELKTDSQVIRE